MPADPAAAGMLRVGLSVLYFPFSEATPGRTIAEAVKEGINVRVIQESNGDIVSGFPTNVPRNPK